MKHHRITAILLALCILVSLTACMPSDPDRTDPETSATTTVPTTTVPPTTTAPLTRDLNLLDYNTGIDTSVINLESFAELYRHAEYILQNYETFTIPRNMKFIWTISDCWVGIWEYSHKKEIEITSDSYILHIRNVNDEDRETARFVIVTALLTKEYEESCCYEFYKYWDSIAQGQIWNFDHAAWLIVTTDFADKGYETIRDYVDAIRKDSSLAGNQTFLIRPVEYKSEFSGLITPYSNCDIFVLHPDNICDDIIAKAFPEE